MNALDFWYEYLGRHLMEAAGVHLARTFPHGTACPRCGAGHRPVQEFRAKAESKGSLVACAACYSLIRAYPRRGRNVAARFSEANAALVVPPPRRSTLLADLWLEGPFERVGAGTNRVRFVAGLLDSLPETPYLLIFFGQDPGIQSRLRICRATGSLEICGADEVRASLGEVREILAGLSDAGVDWREAASVLKLRADLLGSSARRRERIAESLARRLKGNRLTESLLDRLPLPGTDLYRVVSWRARGAVS